MTVLAVLTIDVGALPSEFEQDSTSTLVLLDEDPAAQVKPLDPLNLACTKESSECLRLHGSREETESREERERTQYAKETGGGRESVPLPNELL